MKREIVQVMCEYMYYEKEHGHPIQVLHQDNAKEIVALIKTAKGKDWKLTFTMELTARKTPHSKAKTAFTVIMAQVRSVLIAKKSDF
jgi:hypothetical protein